MSLRLPVSFLNVPTIHRLNVLDFIHSGPKAASSYQTLSAKNDALRFRLHIPPFRGI